MYVPCVDPTQWTQLSLVFHMYGASWEHYRCITRPLNNMIEVDCLEIKEISGINLVDLSTYTSSISVRIQAKQVLHSLDFAVDHYNL